MVRRGIKFEDRRYNVCMCRLGVVLGLLMVFAGAPATSLAAAPPGCQFVLGFKTLHDALPAQIGSCLDDQAFSANGDAVQHTTGGLLAWRKADNWTAFTDGFRTWVNGPIGIQQRLNTERFAWEADGGFGGWVPAGTSLGASAVLGGSSSPIDCSSAQVDGLAASYDEAAGLCRAADAAGVYDGARFVFGTAISPLHDAQPFSRLVASWDAVTPSGTWIEVHARVREAQAWTRWYSLGVWTGDATTLQRHSVAGQHGGNAYVETDTLRTTSPASAYQLAVTLFSAVPGASPTVQDVSAVTFSPRSAASAGAAGAAATQSQEAAIDLPVPARSQMLAQYRGLGFGGGGEVWCSPTSTSMVMAYWADVLGRPELRQSVPTVAAGTYDYTYGGTGNWPFNVAYAASQGLAASIGHFDSFASLRPWIDAKIPVAISIAFAPGQLAGAPIASSPGHLLVVRGFTAAGDVVVNDPAVASDGVSTTYNRAQLERAWQSGSSGIAYLIYPRGWSLPA